MLEQIVSTEFSKVKASNQALFRTDIDYDKEVTKRDKIVKEWAEFTKEQRLELKDQKAFENSRGVLDLKNIEFIPAKNYALIARETYERINASGAIRLLPIDGLDYDESVLEMSESIENADEIRALYRIRKKTTGTTKNAGINFEEAVRLKNCLTQGRELYIAGKNGSLMVKPLNFFYAMTAYSYAIIVLNNPLRISKKSLPGSHGMSYLPDTIQAQFGGDSPRGTFSDLLTAFLTHLVKNSKIEMQIDCLESLLNYYEIKFNVSLGTLISMVPEMAAYYKLTTGENSRCHPLEVTNANDPRSLKWEFQIGNGEHRPDHDSVASSFDGFQRNERYGKIIVTIPASEAHNIKACIYTDIRGNLWFVDNPFFPVILPEVCIHFLINSVYSNVMRYRPDEWGSVLLNEVSPQISLLTRHYFSSFQRKFFILMLRDISRYIPYVA